MQAGCACEMLPPALRVSLAEALLEPDHARLQTPEFRPTCT